VGDEGGFAPSISNNEEGLNLVNLAIEKAGFTGKVPHPPPQLVCLAELPRASAAYHFFADCSRGMVL
jgi:hypothetical protein